MLVTHRFKYMNVCIRFIVLVGSQTIARNLQSTRTKSN